MNASQLLSFESVYSPNVPVGVGDIALLRPECWL